MTVDNFGTYTRVPPLDKTQKPARSCDHGEKASDLSLLPPLRSFLIAVANVPYEAPLFHPTFFVNHSLWKMQRSATISPTRRTGFEKEGELQHSPSAEEGTKSSNPKRNTPLRQQCSNLNMKKVVSSSIFSFLFFLVLDSLITPPEKRLLRPDFSQKFLQWVELHPAQGLIWILLFMSVAVIFMVPIGTPLTLGCGYIYKGAYGWIWGVGIATVVSMMGSAVGAIICFLLGRYLMRETVRKWIRKYPLFDAIDVAAAEHGLRIMAMLYLTPVLPLGPVSYMCGTTSMALHHFIMAKVAALPLMMLYVFIGASAGTLIGKKEGSSISSEVESIGDNNMLIVSGILLSFVSIGVITHFIKQELNKILEKQKKHMEGEHEEDEVEQAATVELGQPRAARQRKFLD